MARRWNEFDDWMQPSRASHGYRNGRIVLSIVLGVVIVYGLGVWSGLQMAGESLPTTPLSTSSTQPMQSPNSPNLLPLQGASGNLITDIYESAHNSVVTITAVTAVGSKNGPQEDIGTGFFIDKRGDIATNAHVVNGLSKVTVTLGNRTFAGQVIGSDALDDLAVVRISPPANIVPLQLGSAKSLRPGNLVVAIGNPFQLSQSVSSGIVSGLNRSMPTQTGHIMNGLVQTDAALNPGNSGGPLFNAAGEVVGINTAIESPVQGSVGIGFAIPIDRLVQLMPQLVSGTNVKHAWLGIEGLDIDPLMQSGLKLPVGEGIYVTVVTHGSPADTAGIKGDTSTKIADLDSASNYQQVLHGDGDIIVAAAGQPVSSVEQLTQIIEQSSPGSVVALTVLRHGQRITFQTTLGNWPATSS